MTSMFQRAMGADFDRLHPKMRERFSVGLDSGKACVASGVMSRIWRGRRFTAPFLRLGATRNILFPEQGADVPFTIENWPYLDRHGRETVTFVRTFDLARRRRRFDATMIFDDATRSVVDYLGTHQHLAAGLEFAADERGGMVVRSTGQRIRVGGVVAPVPEPVTGEATVREWFDDREGRFHIDVRVENRWFGPLFGYRGTFTARYLDVSRTPVPASVKPFEEDTRIQPPLCPQ